MQAMSGLPDRQAKCHCGACSIVVVRVKGQTSTHANRQAGGTPEALLAAERMGSSLGSLRLGE